MRKTATDQERWRRVEELYHAALERGQAERGDFLDQACDADLELRREVESLLAAGGSELLLDRPALDAAAELLDDEQPLAPGTQLGPYRIEGVLGSGGMGRVYRAHDTRLGRTVALKVAKEEFSQRFEQEARTVASLNHSNICPLYDIGPNFLVMELLEGRPLKGPLPLTKAIDYAGQILDALDAAHHKGVIHRDLKPANIMVTRQGIKLLDFGLAKHAAVAEDGDRTLTNGLTGAGMIIGTLQYMSPEQLQSKPVDARSDLFSFGCVLYEMLSGKQAFAGENPASVIAGILEREPAPMEISPPLDRVVTRCVAKDPDQRFQTAIDLKAAMKWALEQTPDVKPPRRWWIAVAGALALGLAGGWAFVHLRRPARDEWAMHFQIPPPKGVRSAFVPTPLLSISPDGRYVTFRATVNGREGLWLHPLDGSAERVLTNSETARLPFWSPDSRSVGWWADAKLWRVDVAGGSPVVVCEPAPPRGAAWTDDGRILFGSSQGVWQVPASGGSPAPLTTVDRSLGETQHGRPVLLPNGRFLCWVQNATARNSAIYAVSLSNPSQRVRLMTSEHEVKFAPAPDGRNYLLMMRNETLVAQEFDIDKLRLLGQPHTVADQIGTPGSPLGMLFAEVSRGGILLYSRMSNSGRFLWFDRAGKPLVTLTEPGPNTGFRLSPDGQRIVLARDDLWILDERQVLSRFTSSPEATRFPVWSPDGQTIVFGRNGLYRKDLRGSGEEQILGELASGVGRTWTTALSPMDWSRDGRFILFRDNSPETNIDLWVLPVSPEGKPVQGTQPRPYLRTPFNETSGRFSPERNPHWVAYQSDATGRYEVYIASFPEPKRIIPITSGGATHPQWRGDGRELYYTSADGKLMVVGLKLQGGSLQASAPRELLQVNRSTYEVAPDGKRILVYQREPNSDPLEVVVNWPALLKK